MLDQLRESWPPANWCDVTVVVAVSGGADSVALVCGLAELRAERPESPAGKLVIAHFNHRLRAGADGDERFVQELAGHLKLPVEVGRAEPLEGRTPTGTPDGIEAAARVARYAFLLATAERVGARYVATAHTADDQAETVLHRVLRGTGLAGLAGIPRVRALNPAVALIRPLLEVCRADVVHYLAERHQTYCIDESNEDPSFTRNRIRHALLPQLSAQYNPNVREALTRLGKLAGEAQQVIDRQAAAFVARGVSFEPSGAAVVDRGELKNELPHLIREVFIQVWKRQQWPLQQMGLEEWQALEQLVSNRDSANTASLNLPGNLRAIEDADRITLRPG